MYTTSTIASVTPRKCSANRHLLAVPRFRLNTSGRRAFSVAGLELSPGFYPESNYSSTDCCKRLLKTYSFVRYLELE